MTDASTPRPTTRALIAGFLLAVVLCAVNSYLTLSFGVIEEGPTIAALFFFAFFFLSKTKITTTEMVIVATMGSAGGSLGFISNFFAAKAMTGTSYTVMEMAGFSIVTSLLGMLFVIPLREMLILKDNLPWPGSKATQSVISSLVEHGDRKQPLYLLLMGILSVAYVMFNTDGRFAGLSKLPELVELPVFGLAAFSLGIAISPFAIGGSYLMGMRTCVGFLVGGLLLVAMAKGGLTPDPANPHKFVYPGIGFLLSTGLTVMALNWRVLRDSMKSIFALSTATSDADPIMGGRGALILAGIALTVTTAFSVLVLGIPLHIIIVLVIVGGFIQNVIATRAAGQTAFNPARVMGVLLEGACALMGGRAANINLAGAGFVAGSGAQAGNLTGDMVYGRWFKVPSRWQFWAQMVTVLPCSIVAAFVFQWIERTKGPLTLDTATLSAPVAKIWAASSLVFEGKSPMPPYAIEGLLIAGVIGVFYVLLEEKTPLHTYLPSSVGIGLGLVLWVPYDVAFFAGGFLMWIVLGRGMKVRDMTLTTIAVACIVGEGIGGVLKSLITELLQTFAPSLLS